MKKPIALVFAVLTLISGLYIFSLAGGFWGSAMIFNNNTYYVNKDYVQIGAIFTTITAFLTLIAIVTIDEKG